jgi:hypothetical protein
MVNELLPPLDEKVASLLAQVDALTSIFPSLSVRSIQIEAGVPNNLIARLKAGEGASYEALRNLEVYLHRKRTELSEKFGAELALGQSTIAALASSEASQQP